MVVKRATTNLKPTMISQNSITIAAKLTNTSDKHLVVGNHADIISAHETAQDATAAIAKIDVDSSRWGIIEVVAPGATTEGEMVAPRPMTAQEESASAADLAKWLKEQQS